MDIYLAVLEDRHIDTIIEPFQDTDEAIKQIEEWKSDYSAKVWEEEEIEGWEYYIRSECDDGPNMRIEKKKLR